MLSILREKDIPVDPQFRPLSETLNSVLVKVGKYALCVLLLALAYFSAALVGLKFAIPPGNATAVWPPSGIAVGVLLLTSWRLVPGIWIGAFLVSLHTGVSPLTAAAFATGNSLASVIGCKLIHSQLNIHQLFHVTRDAFLWLTIAAASCSVAATCGIMSLFVGGYITSVQLFGNWSTWWLGDLTGLMIIAPLFVTLKYSQPRKSNEAGRGERILAFTVLAVICEAIFGGWLPDQTAQSLLYLPVSILVWLVLRAGASSVLVGNGVIATLAIYGTTQGFGAFARESVSQSLLDLQLFLITYSTTGLALCGVVAGSRKSDEKRRFLEIEAEESAQQLRIAHDIQAATFPKAPLSFRHSTCKGVCHPAEETSGDYFDYVVESDGCVVLMIGDVCGHGVGPALITAATRAYTRAVLTSERDLVKIVQRVNQALMDDTDDGNFVTFMVCRFDPSNQTLEYVGAGHEGFVVRKNGDTDDLLSSTFPLGVSTEMVGCELRIIQVARGDIVVMSTDGLFESQSQAGEQFGQAHLRQSFCRYRHLDASRILESVFDDVTAFVEARPAQDDRTAVILKVK